MWLLRIDIHEALLATLWQSLYKKYPSGRWCLSVSVTCKDLCQNGYQLRAAHRTSMWFANLQCAGVHKPTFSNTLTDNITFRKAGSPVADHSATFQDCP